MKENIVDVLDTWLQSRLREMHTALPATIESYAGHDERKATVKIQVRLRTKKGDPLSIPPIQNVPVVFPSAAGFSLLYPLKKGDGCLILFSEEGIGAYLKSKTEVDGDSFARFSLSDAICIPGMWSFRKIPDSKSTIEIDNDGNIILNKGTKGVARLDDTTISDIVTDSAFWTFMAAFYGVVTGPPIPEPGAGAPSAFQAALSIAIAAVGGTPTSQAGKIDSASDTVKAGD